MKRIFACLFITAVLPLMASTTQNSSITSVPFATVAYAGHGLTGGWCECGPDGCICDPGEEPTGQRVHPAPIESNQGKPTQGKATELGSGILLVLAALLITLRYKA